MADNVEIQGLEFQIVNDSTQAVNGLQNLINTLNRLKTATNGSEQDRSGYSGAFQFSERLEQR